GTGVIEKSGPIAGGLFQGREENVLGRAHVIGHGELLSLTAVCRGVKRWKPFPRSTYNAQAGSILSQEMAKITPPRRLPGSGGRTAARRGRKSSFGKPWHERGPAPGRRPRRTARQKREA